MDLIKSHKIIAWDFDDTLVGHFNSQKFHNYIRVNPYDQIFYIVTFRSHGLVDRIAFDLETGSEGLINLSYFADVHRCSDELYEGATAGLITDIIEYQNLKGKICSEIGATVLIDDDTDMVGIGCEKYGIKHFHPDEL